MFRSDVEDMLRDEHGEDGFVYPAYGDYCFRNVPDTVLDRFGVDSRRALPDDVFEGVETDVENVVLVLVDGYGLDSWKRDRRDHEMLDRLTERGTVTPLTSIYPSETAAAITTLHTGQLPCEHGVVGWNVYEPDDDVSFLGLSGEAKAGGDGSDQYDGTVAAGEPVSAALADNCVESHYVQPFEGTTQWEMLHQYGKLDEFGETLASALEGGTAPSYLYGYLHDIDHVSHEHGTASNEFRAVLRDVCAQLERFVEYLDAATARERASCS